ncbi:MAG: hypothetical protein MRERV_41c012 [Mycoplasmataceae bacterium RV_VA103A]|nr:MAG: hypothetical protein MRERV_41c012 [Mycoplasmataceae bacterium RV_VA103A]
MVDKNLFHTTIDNKIVNAKMFNVLENTSPIWNLHYNPSIKVEAGEAKYSTFLWTDPVKWKEDLDYKDFKKGKELQHSLTLKEYGNYGDIFSDDLSGLAFEKPTETKQILNIKMRNILNRMKYDFTETWKTDLGDDNNYNNEADNKGAILKEDKKLFKMGKDATSGITHAEIVWNSIDNQAHRMMDYSKAFNKSKELICTYDMKELILVLRPQVNSMIVSKLYAPSFNVGYVELSSKFGAVVITEPKNAKDHIYLYEREGYQMATAIDHPSNGIFIDTHRYAMSLKSYLFKWLFLFQGMIPFKNAVKWQEA